MRFVCVDCKNVFKENEIIVINGDGNYSMPLFYCAQCYNKKVELDNKPKTAMSIFFGR